MSEDRNRKPGDLATDLEQRPSVKKLVKPHRPRDGFFDFLQDSFLNMIGVPPDQSETSVHMAIVYRVESAGTNGTLGLFADRVRVRARVMEPDTAHSALPIPIGFEDHAMINFLPEFESRLESLGGNPPKVGDPIEVQFKNPTLKTKVYGNGIIRSIVNKRKVQGIYDRSPFLRGKGNAYSPFTGTSALEECKSAREKFGNVEPPGGKAIKGRNKSMTVSGKNPRKLNSPTDDLDVARAEQIIEENIEKPWNTIRVKRNGPLDKNGDGRIDDDIGDRAIYNVTRRRYAGAGLAAVDAGLAVTQVVSNIKGAAGIGKLAKNIRYGTIKGTRAIANEAVDGVGFVGDFVDRPGRPAAELLFAGAAMDPVFGSIDLIRAAAREAGFDANLSEFYLGVKANPEARIKSELDKRKITAQIDCARVYAIKNFVKRTSLGKTEASEAEQEVQFNNLGPVPKTWDRSTDRKIKRLHPQARHVVAEFINVASSIGMFLRVTETYRTPKRQDQLYAKGRTAPGKQVTKARGTPPSSIHQFGIAIDVVELASGRNSLTREKFKIPGVEWVDGYDERYPKDRHRFIGSLGKQFGFIWGGDFKDFFDGYHFEIFSFSPAELRHKLKLGKKVKTRLPDPPFVYPDLKGAT